MIKPRLLPIFISLYLLLWGLPAVATTVLPVSLQQMATTADTIFHGRATSNEVRLDPSSGRVATFTTFEVIEAIKGDVGTSHTIKQIGGQLPGSNVRLLVHGVPKFSVGEEYVVFLPQVSSLGFSSPIGLSQGKFNIRKENGAAYVSNRPALAAQTPTSQRQAVPAAPVATEAGRQPGHPAMINLADFLLNVRGMIEE